MKTIASVLTWKRKYCRS